MREKLNLGLAAAAFATVAYMSFRSSTGAPPAGGQGFRLLLHGFAYFGLAAASLLYFHDTDRGVVEAFVAAVAFGTAIELLQGQVPYRYFSWADIAANTAGASLVLLDHRVEAVTAAIELEDRAIEAALGLK